MAQDDRPVEVSFESRLSEHLAAERLYYRTTWFWKVDRVVAVLLAIFGVVSVSLVGARWWSLIWFPLAIAEWFNLLSLRPFGIAYLFRTNPKYRETYALAFDREGIHFKRGRSRAIPRAHLPVAGRSPWMNLRGAPRDATSSCRTARRCP
jgi:hypothetical protein